MFIVSASSGQKPQFWANFDIWGAPVPTPYYRWEPNLVCYSWPTADAYVSKFVSIGLFEKPQFCLFWTSAFSDVDSWRQSEKVEYGCTTTNLPLSKVVTIISVLQRLHGEIGRTNSDVQKRDGQTKRVDRQKTHRFSPPRRRIKSDSHQTWRGDRELRARSFTSKRLGVWCIVSPLRGTENLGVTRPCQIKTP